MHTVLKLASENTKKAKWTFTKKSWLKNNKMTIKVTLLGFCALCPSVGETEAFKSESLLCLIVSDQ
jgi:hypothetical protein